MERDQFLLLSSGMYAGCGTGTISQGSFKSKDVPGDNSGNVYTTGSAVNSWSTFLKNVICGNHISGIFKKGRDER